MSIEIVIGLPHLNEGPILARARALRQPVLISANALSPGPAAAVGGEWTGWRLSQLANAHGLASLDLDSAGFVAMSRYRGFPWTVDDYFRLATAYPFRRIASLDYCTEHEVAADREEVLDRLSSHHSRQSGLPRPRRGVRAARPLHARYPGSPSHRLRALHRRALVFYQARRGARRRFDVPPRDRRTRGADRRHRASRPNPPRGHHPACFRGQRLRSSLSFGIRPPNQLDR